MIAICGAPPERGMRVCATPVPKNTRSREWPSINVRHRRKAGGSKTPAKKISRAAAAINYPNRKGVIKFSRDAANCRERKIRIARLAIRGNEKKNAIIVFRHVTHRSDWEKHGFSFSLLRSIQIFRSWLSEQGATAILESSSEITLSVSQSKFTCALRNHKEINNKMHLIK